MRALYFFSPRNISFTQRFLVWEKSPKEITIWRIIIWDFAYQNQFYHHNRSQSLAVSLHLSSESFYNCHTSFFVNFFLFAVMIRKLRILNFLMCSMKTNKNITKMAFYTFLKDATIVGHTVKNAKGWCNRDDLFHCWITL